ncbi:TPA: hypothetical protein HA241_07570 [Candidatus Woesearchaeota archaeon]|nr:hypothetical protein [Candidatus Woesearchaeota archaeon]
MSYQKTWEVIVEPENPFPIRDLRVHTAQGEPLKFPLHRVNLNDEILRYWDRKQIEMVTARAETFAQALRQVDTPTIARMQRQIGGIDQKYRCTAAVLRDQDLYLALSVTNYMMFVGTNERAINDQEFRARLIQAGLEDAADPNRYFANPLAMCAVVYGFNRVDDHTSIYVPIALRSDKVAIYPNVHHVFGGIVDVGEQGGRIDFGERMRTELREEIGLEDREMGDLSFRGIIRQGPSRIPEVISSLPIYVDQNTLQERWRTKAPAKFEHRNLTLYGIRDIEPFLEEYGATMVPSGAAALDSFLRHHSESLGLGEAQPTLQ